MKISFYDPDDEKPPRPKKKRKDRGFTMDWVSELGWKKNPFRLEGARIADYDDERQEINVFFVKQRRFGVIYGEDGMGKTTLLEWLLGELDGYKDIDAHYLDADMLHEELSTALAAPYSGLFSAKGPMSDDELAALISKKAKGRYVLLVDNAQSLTATHMKTLDHILEIDSTVILATNTKPKDLPHEDQLGLTIEERTPKDYEKILADRIEDADGMGIHPFTQAAVQRMADDTETVSEFLELAHETAINIALKKANIDEEVDEEALAIEQEEKAEQKKGLKKKREEKKREYDELIESLTEGME